MKQMEGDMALQRDLSLTNLTLAVVTGTIGSGWLFAPYFTAKLAGGGASWPGALAD